jgi:hypothetical protein
MYPARCTDERCGAVIPLATYAEEPMHVAPLHFWTWERGTPVPKRPIVTDVREQYAAVAATFGAGRMVLFGPHPERATYFDGYVREFPVRPRLAPFTWFIYDWVSESRSGLDYNWWMLHRSVAWIARCPLPPVPSGT